MSLPCDAATGAIGIFSPLACLSLCSQRFKGMLLDIIIISALLVQSGAAQTEGGKPCGKEPVPP